MYVQAETIQFHSSSKSDGHSYLSNMYGLPKIAQEFDSVERFYQFHRFLAINAQYANDVILLAADDETFDRDQVMRRGLRLKFAQNPALKDARLEELGRFDYEYWTSKGDR
jgi:predicted NAD-dependent protein-ADP-ribosyltransferase YbiA (DUF1768 family)